MITNINSMAGLELIATLKTLDGALSYDGECSTQVAFKLKNGRTIRFGVTDDDVADSVGLWVDQYPGLQVVGGDPLSRHEEDNMDRGPGSSDFA